MDKWFALCWDNSGLIKISIQSSSWMALPFYLVSFQETATVRDQDKWLWNASILDPETSINSILQMWLHGNGEFCPKNAIGNSVKPINQLINTNVENAILLTNEKICCRDFSWWTHLAVLAFFLAQTEATNCSDQLGGGLLLSTEKTCCFCFAFSKNILPT